MSGAEYVIVYLQLEDYSRIERLLRNIKFEKPDRDTVIEARG